jgi:hypothetical protein
MNQENCDTGSNFDWEDQTLQVVTESAKFGVPGAIAELDKRRKAMEKLDTVTPKFSVIEDED